MVGIADDDLRSIAIEPSGAFLIAGPPGSGRTNALEIVARGAAALMNPPQLYLLSPRRSTLTRSKIWKRSADSGANAKSIIAELSTLLDQGLEPGRVALFIENLSDFGSSGDEYELERVIKALLKNEQFVVAESETSSWSQAYSLGQPLRAGRRGLLLQPDESDGDLLLSTSLGRIRRGSLPVGRGFSISQGRARRLQVAICDGER